MFIFVVLFPASFNVGPLFMTLLRAMMLCMTPWLLVRLFSGAYGRILLTDWLFLAYVAWIGLALTLRSPTMAVTQLGSLGIEFLGGYMVGRAYIRNREDMVSLVLLLGKVALILLPLAIYETRTGRSLILTLIEAIPGVGSPNQFDMSPRMGLIRVQGPFPHPILFGLYCSLPVALTLVGLRGVISDRQRFLLAGASAACVFTSLSSGALLAVVLQIMLIVWWIIFRNNTHRWKILLGCAVAFYVIIDMLSNRSPLDVFMSYATFSSGTAYTRKLIFNWGMVNVRANPIFGIGMNDWVRAHFMGPSIDNFWLLVAMRYGTPGLILLAGGYFHAIWRIGRRNFGGDPLLLNLRRSWVFTFCGLAFTLSTVHIWNNVFSFVFFLFGAGIWLAAAIPAEGNARAEDPAPPRAPRYSRFPPHGPNPEAPPKATSRFVRDDPSSAVAPDQPERTPPIHSRQHAGNK